jgi:glycerophosphoryl diester phosphodiesterase
MTRVYAHRGASGCAPENTLAAFSLACQMGAGGIELDVQMTCDGELVVIHDETVDRTTDSSGWVKDMTYSSLREFNASMGSALFPDEYVPTLAEVLDVCENQDLLINIELKDSVVPYVGLAQKVVAVVESRGLHDQVILSSFNHLSLGEVSRLSPHVRTGLLFSDVLVRPWDYAQQLGVHALHPHYRYVDIVPEVVERSHHVGLDVNVWTVDETPDMVRMINTGVDGIFTNHPDRALAMMPHQERT